MKVTIDNLDGRGPQDYTAFVGAGKASPTIHRRLNQPGTMTLSVTLGTSGLAIPAIGAHIAALRADASLIFTGLLTAVNPEFAGNGERGAVCGYSLTAETDELALNRKTLPVRSEFVNRTAGDILRQLAVELLPGGLDVTQVADLDVVPKYQSSPQKTWSAHAAELGILSRGRYLALNGQLVFQAIGGRSYTLDEASPKFNPMALKLTSHGSIANDVTMLGGTEPQAYVTDYFVGDGVTLRFTLSQTPFSRTVSTVLDEEWTGATFNTLNWIAVDPTAVVAVGQGKLQISGGTGVNGQTLVQFVEKIDMSGSNYLQHGDTSFSNGSDGVMGGLYAGAVNIANCVAGFRVTPAAGQSVIQALINGTLTGAALTTQPGHRYVFATRSFSSEGYRRGALFHSSIHPAGNARGGAVVAATVRIVLEVHEIDPSNPGSLVSPAIVLYDGLINSVPDACTYALVNAASLHCAIAFTRILQASDVLVRSAFPGVGFRTRLVGAQIDGAECSISTAGALSFFASSAPAANEQIVAVYRSARRAVARVQNSASIAALQSGNDDGTRGTVVAAKLPLPHTHLDCVNAASALLDDKTQAGWAGEYDTWSGFLPGDAGDIFPGDGLQVNVPSQGAQFIAVVREVVIGITDLSGGLAQYKIRFANEAAEPIAFRFEVNSSRTVPSVPPVPQDIAVNLPPDLVAAQITQVSSTTTTIDIGQGVPPGYGVEVRRTDSGWGPDNDRNLVGRFSTQGSTVPRLAKRQDYFLKLFDASTPRQYSQHPALLHIDFPY